MEGAAWSARPWSGHLAGIAGAARPCEVAAHRSARRGRAEARHVAWLVARMTSMAHRGTSMPKAVVEAMEAAWRRSSHATASQPPGRPAAAETAGGTVAAAVAETAREAEDGGQATAEAETATPPATPTAMEAEGAGEAGATAELAPAPAGEVPALTAQLATGADAAGPRRRRKKKTRESSADAEDAELEQALERAAAERAALEAASAPAMALAEAMLARAPARRCPGGHGLRAARCEPGTRCQRQGCMRDVGTGVAVVCDELAACGFVCCVGCWNATLDGGTETAGLNRGEG